MNKKYYYLKQKVEIGDVIDYNGLKIILTEEIVNNNPDLFAVEEEKEVLFTTEDGVDYYYFDRSLYWAVNIRNYEIYVTCNTCNKENLISYYKRFSTLQAAENYVKLEKEKKQREELLEEAKRRYPIGTKFYLAHVPEKAIRIVTGNWKVETYCSNVVVDADKQGQDLYTVNCIYYDGKWAEIIKDKTLQDYENILLDNNGVFIGSNTLVWGYSSFYTNLKILEPKLYYTKVLQLIADDLNEGWKANWKDGDSDKYHVYYRGGICFDSSQEFNRGIVYFKSKNLAQKASEIMKDKINLIFE